MIRQGRIRKEAMKQPANSESQEMKVKRLEDRIDRLECISNLAIVALIRLTEELDMMNEKNKIKDYHCKVDNSFN